MDKVSQKLLNLNSVSKKLLRYGMFVIFIFCVVASILVKNATTVSSLSVAREFISGNVYAFCEVIIGAIMLDMMIIEDEKTDKKNDR